MTSFENCFWRSRKDADKDETTPLYRSSGIGHLGSAAVLAIIWFNVSGGPVGSEQVISYGGPIIGLASMVIIAILFSVPQVLMTAELSSALPHNGGYSIWVQEAFGDFWGLQESYYSWVSGVVDNALYPLLLYSSVTALLAGNGLLPDGLNGCQAASILNNNANGSNPTNLWSCVFASSGNCALEYLLKVLIVLIFTIPALLNNKSVGFSMTLFMGLVIMPFAVMCAIGVFEMRPYDWLPLPNAKDVNFVGLFNVAFWNLTGFDCSSTFAHEIAQPRHQTLPRALFWSLGLMLLCYLLPLGIGAAVDKDWHCWTDGSLTYVAQLIGGNWLGMWVLLSTLLSTWGQYVAELFEDSYQLLGMAEVGLAPRCFSGRLSETGAPVAAMLFQVVIICVLVSLDFNAILVIDNFFYAIGAILEFGALIKLRISKPDMPRPFLIPLGIWGLSLCLLPTLVAAVALLWANATSSITSAVVCIGGVVLGLLLGVPFALSGNLGERLRQIENEEA